MKKEQITSYQHKQVRLFMKDKTLWTGKITFVDEEYTSIIDKFNRKVTISNFNIIALSEWG